MSNPFDLQFALAYKADDTLNEEENEKKRRETLPQRIIQVEKKKTEGRCPLATFAENIMKIKKEKREERCSIAKDNKAENHEKLPVIILKRVTKGHKVKWRNASLRKAKKETKMKKRPVTNHKKQEKEKRDERCTANIAKDKKVAADPAHLSPSWIHVLATIDRVDAEEKMAQEQIEERPQQEAGQNSYQKRKKEQRTPGQIAKEVLEVLGWRNETLHNLTKVNQTRKEIKKVEQDVITSQKKCHERLTTKIRRDENRVANLKFGELAEAVVENELSLTDLQYIRSLYARIEERLAADNVIRGTDNRQKGDEGTASDKKAKKGRKRPPSDDDDTPIAGPSKKSSFEQSSSSTASRPPSVDDLPGDDNLPMDDDFPGDDLPRPVSPLQLRPRSPELAEEVPDVQMAPPQAVAVPLQAIPAAAPRRRRRTELELLETILVETPTDLRPGELRRSRRNLGLVPNYALPVPVRPDDEDDN